MEVLVGPELLELPELPTLELPELGVMGAFFTQEITGKSCSVGTRVGGTRTTTLARIHIQVSVASLVNPVHGQTQFHRSFLKLATVF